MTISIVILVSLIAVYIRSLQAQQGLDCKNRTHLDIPHVYNVPKIMTTSIIDSSAVKEAYLNSSFLHLYRHETSAALLTEKLQLLLQLLSFDLWRMQYKFARMFNLIYITLAISYKTFEQQHLSFLSEETMGKFMATWSIPYHLPHSPFWA